MKNVYSPDTQPQQVFQRPWTLITYVTPEINCVHTYLCIVCKCANCVQVCKLCAHLFGECAHSPNRFAQRVRGGRYILSGLVCSWNHDFYLSDESHFTVPGMKIIFQSKGVMWLCIWLEDALFFMYIALFLSASCYPLECCSFNAAIISQGLSCYTC